MSGFECWLGFVTPASCSILVMSTLGDIANGPSKCLTAIRDEYLDWVLGSQHHCWYSPGHCRHSESESAHGRVVVFFSSLCQSLKKKKNTYTHTHTYSEFRFTVARSFKLFCKVVYCLNKYFTQARVSFLDAVDQATTWNTWTAYLSAWDKVSPSLVVQLPINAHPRS